ncbi:hypothetical protein E2562_030714 [Oryza meyeriana var. granulata]|uniref:Uncharacterized protein n=1 Tax=Oryza meyeriana var. granulata TaxID=110450 RepID=A0A6G1CU87_9ORYZ|nr:hypothetical protein E2562_030714 [Oryza meyeriana var. granulata]
MAITPADVGTRGRRTRRARAWVQNRARRRHRVEARDRCGSGTGDEVRPRAPIRPRKQGHISRRYELRLRPDLVAYSFTGAASILVDDSTPTRFLVLNTADLTIDRTSIRF